MNNACEIHVKHSVKEEYKNWFIKVCNKWLRRHLYSSTITARDSNLQFGSNILYIVEHYSIS